MSVRQGNNGFIAERLGGFVRDETDAPALARHSMNSQIEYSSCLLYTSPSPRDS